jgi:hypothetical protein
MGYRLIPKAAKIDKRRVGLKETNQRREGFKAFEGSN